MTAGKNNSVLLNISVVTVSDTRTQQTDESGSVLVKRVAEFGHKVYSKEIIPDDVYELRAVISRLIADPNVQAIILTGGTGFTERDNTQLAIEVLFDTHIDGFGELFRNLSYNELGTSTI